jgi:hypothetical protein
MNVIQTGAQITCGSVHASGDKKSATEASTRMSNSPILEAGGQWGPVRRWTDDEHFIACRRKRLALLKVDADVIKLVDTCKVSNSCHRNSYPLGCQPGLNDAFPPGLPTHQGYLCAKSTRGIGSISLRFSRCQRQQQDQEARER